MQSLFILRKCLIESEEDDLMICVTLGAYGRGGAKSWFGMQIEKFTMQVMVSMLWSKI